MIQKQQAKSSKGKRVNYSGTNRTYLNKDSADLRLTGSVSDYSESAQVTYKDVYGNSDTTWVGLAYLTFVNDEFTEAINKLKAKLEISKTEVIQLEAAIKTLEEL